LVQARLRSEQLQEDLSVALDFLYWFLVWIVKLSPGLQAQVCRLLRFKFLQLPQGSRFGRRLIELDAQSGGLLDSGGIYLERWVYEPREK
jgi:hypothetical protein